MERWRRTLLTLPAACARLLVMLALLLLPLGGHPVAACEPAEAAAQPAAAQPGHHGMDHASHATRGAHADTALHSSPDGAADHDPAARPRTTHALCCLSTCPACLWQDVAAPPVPAPLKLAANRPPAETPVPPGHAPSPALDPPRTPA